MSENIYTLESFSKAIAVSMAETTVKEYQGCLRSFFSFYDKNPAEIKKTDILNYVSFLSDKKIGASFLKLNFFAVKKYYRYLVKNEAFDRSLFYDIFDDVDLPKVVFKSQKVYLKKDTKQILSILEQNCNSFEKFGYLIFILIAATTGARRHEIASLKVEDIDFETEHICFYNTKNKKPRAIKMNKYLVEKLREYIIKRENASKNNTNSSLFLNTKGEQATVAVMDSRIRGIVKKHGLEISYHAFRRGLATELSNARVPIDKISKILGHSNISITANIYVYNSDLDEAVLSYNLII